MSFQQFSNIIFDILRRYFFFPIAIVTVIMATLVFSVFSTCEIQYFHSHFEQEHKPDVASALNSLKISRTPPILRSLRLRVGKLFPNSKPKRSKMNIIRET
jgi:hypothetical protein